LAEYQQAVESMEWDMTFEGGFLFPGVYTDGTKRYEALAPEHMTANLQSYLKAAQVDDHYTMHSFRVGGAVTHHMSGTPFEVHGLRRVEVRGRSSALRWRYAFGDRVDGRREMRPVNCTQRCRRAGG